MKAWWNQPPSRRYPEVHPDRRITFHVNAPKASQVALEFGEWDVKPRPMTRHGGGDSEASWSQEGRAGVILENLLAQRNAVPMVIAMTNGMTDSSWAGGSSPEGMAVLERELLLEP